MYLLRRLLLVEPDDRTRERLEAAAAPYAFVESFRDFPSARARMRVASFDFLLTNVKLHDYNGMHLVHVGAASDLVPIAIVYTDQRDPGLGAMVQQAGAFYETTPSLLAALATYLTSPLPVRDRRDPATPDRRRRSRGGRRLVDRSATTLASA
jgi:DNA-binding NtrC family response regulator